MERQQMQVEPGASVEARDGRLGTVDEVIVRPETGELAYLVIQRGWTGEHLVIPAELIDRIASPREVRLRATREEARAQTADVPREAFARASGGELRIPLVEERLVPARRVVDQGELRIHRHVEEVEEVLREPVTRDDLVVERVAVNRPLEAPAEARYEDDWLVIPVMEEVLVVQKRLMLKEEIRVRKRQVTEAQEVRATVRRQRAEIEDATVHGVQTVPTPGPTTTMAAVDEGAVPDPSAAETGVNRAGTDDRR